MTRKCQYSVADPISQMAGTVRAISTAMTMRPPYLSVQMPSGTRTSEPVSTGIAVSRPNCVALRLSIFLIGMPMTPNIIQTMKQTVKARVLTMSTDQAWRVRRGSSAATSDGDAICFPLLPNALPCSRKPLDVHIPRWEVRVNAEERGPTPRP